MPLAAWHTRKGYATHPHPRAYVDEDFQPHDEWFEGYLTRVLQHEVDHLDGVLFTDHLSPFRKQLIKNKLKALLQGKYRCSYRTKLATR